METPEDPGQTINGLCEIEHDIRREQMHRHFLHFDNGNLSR
jgi:hypothetical protein